ncbi:MAG TPA: carbohydrate ABC transporter permease [Chloroflexota bacterium]|nr:carbohydrate ABC transporter permease [Chloroflexota bacterium]
MQTGTVSRPVTAARVPARPSRSLAGTLEKALKVLAYVILLVWALVSLLPVYLMISTSIKASTVVMEIPPQWFPNPISFDSYDTLLQRSELPRWFLNTAFVSVAVTVGTVIVNALAAYPFAKLRFPGDRYLFWGLLALIMVPYVVVWVPLFILVSNLGLLDTYWILIVPGFASVWNFFLFKQFMQTLPSSLIDAARIDACSEPGIFWQVILPLAKPAVAVVAIFSFVWQWNSFFWWLLFTNSSEMRNLAVGLAQYRYQNTIDYGPLMAGATVSALPVIVIFLLFQRYFMEGLTIGAIKG